VEGLGYAFLFRNYAAGLGKWTTSDPLGYPDGWNNFAYGNNAVTSGIDAQGTEWVLISTTDTRKPQSDPIEISRTLKTESTGDTLIVITHSSPNYILTGSGSTTSPNGYNRIEIDYYDSSIIETKTVTRYTRVNGVPTESSNVVWTTDVPGPGATVTRRYIWE
jgi:hypothetical protein